MNLVRAALLLVMALLAPAALAWGEVGHRVVADLATRQLRPAAAAEVARLLAAEPEPTLAGIANWADDLREMDGPAGRRSKRWHFVNFPAGACQYVPARDCPNGDCVIAAINRNLAVLADRARADGERRDALKFVVHLVGDVHQPLHASAGIDRGGNDFQVAYHGMGRNLHGVWDGLILFASGRTAEQTSEFLWRKTALPRDTTAGSDRQAVAWALESCQVAATVYPKGHVIGDDYLRAHLPQAETRLRLAGARLAGLINDALDPPRGRATP